jgi:hypothetical protein
MDISCTLGGAELATQRERWLAVRRTARIEADDGLRLTFPDEPAIEAELLALVAVENDCCSWATWTVERREDELVMAARSSGHGVAVLHSMFR